MTLTFEQLPILYQAETLFHVEWLSVGGLQTTRQRLEDDLKQEALRIWQDERYEQDNVLRNLRANNNRRGAVVPILDRIFQYKREWKFGGDGVIDRGYASGRGGNLMFNI